ncbi:hypothetical protein [Sulfurimonas sp.]
MKKIVLALLLMLGCLYAEQSLVLIKKFNQFATPSAKAKVENLRNKDRHFNNAIELLTNKSKMRDAKIVVGDYEEAEHGHAKLETKIIKLPDYPKILKELRKSFYQYHNPLSAYIAMSIIKTKIPARGIDALKAKRDYAKALYENVNSCNSYLDYFDVLYNGIATKPDLQGALKVIKSAKKCMSHANDWQKVIIGMKEDKVKLKLGIIGPKKKVK